MHVVKGKTKRVRYKEGKTPDWKKAIVTIDINPSDKTYLGKGGKEVKASKKYKEMGIQTCQEAAKLDPKALGLCATGCLGQGACTAVCRYDAIKVVDGVAKVDPDKCVGCKDCTYACPKHIITIVPYKGIKMVS